MTKIGYQQTHEHSAKISASLRRHYSVIEHHRKGCKLSELHRGRISLALRVDWLNYESRRKRRSAQLAFYKKNPDFMGGENNPFYGKHHTDNVKSYLMLINKGKFVGERSGKWKGGKSFLPYKPEFNESLKELVRNLFNRECVVCFLPEFGQSLDVHHLDKDKSNNSVENLVPVHHSMCHRLIEGVNPDVY